jgi:hypothetical protein
MTYKEASFCLYITTAAFTTFYGKAVMGADPELFFGLFERCRVAIESSLPFDNDGLEVWERKNRDNETGATECDSTTYATEGVFLVGVFDCYHKEWEQPRSFCAVYTPHESPESNSIDPAAWGELFESKYRYLDELGSHEVVYAGSDAMTAGLNGVNLELNLIGANGRGCPVYNFLRIDKDGAEIRGTSSESLSGKCDYNLPD